MKALHIHGKRWFQKSFGNTYHSCSIYVDGEFTHKTEIEYGYGDQYAWTAREWLKDNGYLPGITDHEHGGGESLWGYCERDDIKFADEATDVSRERDL